MDASFLFISKKSGVSDDSPVFLVKGWTYDSLCEPILKT